MIPPQRISDLSDPRLDGFRCLPGRIRHDDPDLFVAESEIAVLRLLESDLEVQAVVLTPARLQRVAPLVPEHAPIYVLEPRELRALVGFNLRRGVAAIARRPAQRPLRFTGAERLIVLAEGVADPLNVGALARNCSAFAVDLLVLDPACGDPLSRKAIRASMGQVFHQPLAQIASAALLAAARSALGATVAAATTSATAIPLHTWHPTGPVVLLLGAEGPGLSPNLLANADVHVRIPIRPDVDSLNVAAASAILLYAINRGQTYTLDTSASQ